jgi:hypothetical protein
MSLVASSTPLFIESIVRFNGITTVKITGHGFSGAHVGLPLRVSKVADPSYNGTFTVASVPDSNTITYAQAGKNDNHIDLTGGAISVG